MGIFAQFWCQIFFMLRGGKRSQKLAIQADTPPEGGSIRISNIQIWTSCSPPREGWSGVNLRRNICHPVLLHNFLLVQSESAWNELQKRYNSMDTFHQCGAIA